MPDGLNILCRECVHNYKQEYYKKNYDKIMQKKKEYYQTHKDIIKAYAVKNREHIRQRNKEYRATHREQEREQKRKWNAKNHDKVLLQKRLSYQRLKDTSVKVWKEKNRDIILAKKREYRENNKEKIKEYKERTLPQRREYVRRKYNSDIQFRLKNVLRHRISEAVKAQGKIKRAKTITLIGCSIPELKKHLESQFKIGMSWDNYGDWHIDHIIPCAAFDLTDIEQQKKCFNYKNLQPLWAEENLKKLDFLPDGRRAVDIKK